MAHCFPAMEAPTLTLLNQTLLLLRLMEYSTRLFVHQARFVYLIATFSSLQASRQILSTRSSQEIELLPFSPGLWVVMGFSLITAWSTLAWSERLNREVPSSASSNESPFNFEKRKRGMYVGDLPFYSRFF